MKKDYIFVAQFLKQPEQKEVKIEIPEGYEIDKEKSTFEKIVFKKKDNRPRSWEEYCNNFKGEFYYIIDDRDNIGDSFTTTGLISAYKNTLPSKELAEKFLAYMQLMSLRQAWIGDWKAYPGAVAITWSCDGRLIRWQDPERCLSLPLSFPTKEMAEEFMFTFRDLLEQAEGLY